MIHKYFAYKIGDQWRMNDLLSMDQTRALLGSLGWKKEVFASVQDYDEFGNIVACPLYFDLDGGAAIDDCRALVAACEYLVNITPRIYFSGNKGFHLIIERKLEHPRCHELAKNFAQEIAGAYRTVDYSVYRTRAMLRINGSPASKPGAFKIELHRTELMSLTYDEIKDLARTQRFIDTGHDPSKMNDDQINSWLALTEPTLPKYNLDTLAGAAKDVGLEMTPCLRTILTTEAPIGSRHSSAFLLARFLKQCGVDLQSAISTLLSLPHWKAYDSTAGEVRSILTSTYRSRSPALLGCKSDSDGAVLMRSFCDELCPIRADFPKRSFKEQRRPA